MIKLRNKVLLFLCMLTLVCSMIGCGEISKKDTKDSKGKVLTGFPEFKSIDVKGKEVTSNIFKDKKITVVNIWGSFCGPCIEELPSLQEIYTEMKDKGVNVIGIVSDGEENKDLAIKILNREKVTYTNIIPNKEIQDNLLNNFNAVPITFLVDKDKKIIGDILLGARSKQQYKQIIEDALNSIK